MYAGVKGSGRTNCKSLELYHYQFGNDYYRMTYYFIIYTMKFPRTNVSVLSDDVSQSHFSTSS